MQDVVSAKVLSPNWQRPFVLQSSLTRNVQILPSVGMKSHQDLKLTLTVWVCSALGILGGALAGQRAGCSGAGSVVSWKEPRVGSQGLGVPASALTVTTTLCSPHLSEPHFSLLPKIPFFWVSACYSRHYKYFSEYLSAIAITIMAGKAGKGGYGEDSSFQSAGCSVVSDS